MLRTSIFREVDIVKKFVVVSALILMMSAFVFGFGIELGAGVNNLILPFPTIAAGVNVPIAGNISLTGQFNMLFLPITTESAPTSMTFMVLGGGRYTFDMKQMKLFVGADGGVMTDFTGASAMIPVFGINGGVLFQMFYIKGAMRWMSISSGEPSTGPGLSSFLLQLTELTAGINWVF